MTSILASAKLLVPIEFIYPGSEYQTQVASELRVPPVWVKVTLFPLQIVDAEVFKVVGATDGGLTVTSKASVVTPPEHVPAGVLGVNVNVTVPSVMPGV